MLQNPFLQKNRISNWIRYPNPFTMKELLELATLFNNYGEDSWKLSHIEASTVKAKYAKLFPDAPEGCKICGNNSKRYGLNTNIYDRVYKFLTSNK